eukprot:9594385-Alexandrium_andersonii.AAC.1
MCIRDRLRTATWNHRQDRGAGTAARQATPEHRRLLGTARAGGVTLQRTATSSHNRDLAGGHRAAPGTRTSCYQTPRTTDRARSR